MRFKLTLWMVGAIGACAPWAMAAEVVDSSAKVGGLAEYVPVDARLFLEVRDAAGLGRAPAGEALGEVLALGDDARQGGGSRPSRKRSRGGSNWFAGALGLQDERVAELLLSGRMAMAADSWKDLSAAASGRRAESLPRCWKTFSVRPHCRWFREIGRGGTGWDAIRRWRSAIAWSSWDAASLRPISIHEL